MKKLLFLLLPCSCLFYYSCSCGLNGCNCVDCIGNDVFNIQLLSKTDSSDLLVTGAINPDSLQIFQLNNGHETAFNFREAGGNKPFITMEAGVSAFVLQYSAGQRDTLQVQTHTSPKSQCCGKAVLLQGATFKGNAVTPVLGTTGMMLKLFAR